MENYIAEESVEFCSEYLSNADPVGLPTSGVFTPKGLSVAVHSPVKQDEWEKACLYVLHNAKEVEPFVEIHITELRVMNLRKTRYEKWI